MKFGTARIFAPEQWGTLEKFSKFYSETFQLKKSGQRSVSGAINHFHKCLILKQLALKLVPNSDLDEAELEQNGYTNATNSKELSAVIESSILELYSSVDCTRKVITEIYSKEYQGVPNSTRKYFDNIINGKIDDKFPEQLLIAVKETDWYDELRKLRDELTHLDTGTCHKNKETQKVSYMHSGFSIDGKALIIDDIFLKLEQHIAGVNQFIGRIFSFLLSQLEDKPVLQLCGIFNGRMYTRHVSPFEAKDFHSGTCDAKKWFELDENPSCIFVNECGAYKNANK